MGVLFCCVGWHGCFGFGLSGLLLGCVCVGLSAGRFAVWWLSLGVLLWFGVTG